MKNHRLRTTAAVAIGCLTALATVVAGPAATAAAPTTEIKPAALDRGEPGRVPHVDGDALVVAHQRYDFHDREVRFLGFSGPALDEYVVGVYVNGRPRSHKVIRVTPDGDRTVVLTGASVPELSLSSDGEEVFRSVYRVHEKQTVLRGWSADDGSLLHRRVFRGYATVLDAFGGEAVLGASLPERTFRWDLGTGATSRISRRSGYAASIQQDRLAVLTGDPYLDGCSVVSTLADPSEPLWRSCRQAVAEFSPSGDRVVTTYLLADGLGPGEYQLREITGTLVRRFTAYYFGEVLWEADDVLLVRAHGRKKHAWVRCTDAGDCERTSRLRENRI